MDKPDTKPTENMDVTGNDKAEQDIQNTEHATEKGGQMIPKSRFDQVIGQKKEAETALEEIAQGLIEEIPETMRDLIPDLPTAKKIKWLQTATKKGIFSAHGSNSPDSKRPGTKQVMDWDNMTATQKMAMGYSHK